MTAQTPCDFCEKKYINGDSEINSEQVFPDLGKLKFEILFELNQEAVGICPSCRAALVNALIGKISDILRNRKGDAV